MKWQSRYKAINGVEYIPSHSREFYHVSVRQTQVGLGLFSEETIQKESVVFQDGGILVTSLDDLPAEYRGYGVVIERGLYLLPRDYENKDKCCYLNHSCNPNLKRIGYCTYVARRDVQVGDELTVDYSPLIATLESVSLNCLCGFWNCRKIISGNDWKNAELAEALWAEWPPFVQKEIMKIQSIGSS